MTVEEFYVDFLSDALNVPVSGNIPDPMPERFVTIEKIGSRYENYLYHPVIAVQSWAGSRMDAARLNEEVKLAMVTSIRSARISRCNLDTDYNFPDLDLKRARYQAVFDITYLD